MTFEQALNDASSVVTLAGFPLVIAGFVTLLIKTTDRVMLKRILVAIFFATALVAYSIDIYDRFWVDHSYKYAFSEIKAQDVACRDFFNEEVVLDAKSYSNCTFNNVTIVYNGTASFAFSHNRLNGNVIIKSYNPGIVTMLALLKGLGYLTPGTPLLNKPSNMRIEEIHRD